MSAATPSSPPPENAMERLDPYAHIDQESTAHLARYRWTCQFMPAPRVLDCACGFGYGTALLAQAGAQQIIGVDQATEALDYARLHYNHPAITYVQADALKLDTLQLGSFDRIVSLETIEHLAKPQRLLDLFRSLLAPGGILLLSCPNDNLVENSNPFHCWKIDYDQFHSWLRERFSHVVCWAEVQTQGTGIWPIQETQVSPESAGSQSEPPSRVLDTLPLAEAAGYLFACSDQPLAEMSPTHVSFLGAAAYRRSMLKAKDWLDEQRNQWMQAAQQQEKVIAECRQMIDDGQRVIQEKDQFISEIQEAKNWLEAQRANWMKTAQECQEQIDRQNGRIAELQQELERRYQLSTLAKNTFKKCRSLWKSPTGTPPPSTRERPPQ